METVSDHPLWLRAFFIAVLTLALPINSFAVLYPKALNTWLEKPPWHNTGQDIHATAYASDIVISQSQISTTRIPIALLLPGTPCLSLSKSTDTETAEASAPQCVIPDINVSLIHEGADWTPIQPNDDMAHYDNGMRHQFTINLPSLNPQATPNFLVVRVHVKENLITTEFKFMVVVIPDGMKPEIVVYDYDGTVAVEFNRRAPMQPQKFVQDDVQKNFNLGRLICYNTTRPVDQTESLREWLLDHDLPPGPILAAPEALNRKNEWDRKAFKLSVLQGLNTLGLLLAMWGDSAIADAMAGMEAAAMMVHLIHSASDRDSDPARIRGNMPHNYSESKGEIRKQRFSGRQIGPRHIVYTRSEVILVQPVERPVQCVGLSCLPPTPNQTLPLTLHPAHSAIIRRALQLHPDQPLQEAASR